MSDIKYTILLALAAMLPAAAGAQTDSVQHLGEVVVTGTRNAVDVRQLPMTVNIVTRGELTRNRQASILPTLQQRIPGFMLTSRGMLGYGVAGGAAGSISLRGVSGGAGQMLVLIDGHPQYQGVYGHPIADSYQTLMAERVEVLRGPASVLYGSNAMGGVVNIVTRGMHRDGVLTTVHAAAGSYGTVKAEATNQLRRGRFGSTVGAQYGRSDNHRPRMGFEQYGGMMKAAYDLNGHWNASAGANITHFNASNPGLVTAPLYDARQWITRGEVSLALENHYGSTSGAVSLYSNFGRHKINDGTSNPAAPQSRYFRSKDALSGLSLFQSATLLKGNRVTVGFDWQNIYGRAYYTSIATGETLDTPNKQSAHSHRNEVAGYVEVRQELASWLTIDAGLRIDHHSITGTEWIPQGGIAVRPMANGTLKAMVSKGFRNPSMRELYLYPPSNTDLRPERMMNYELSWRHTTGGGNLTYGLNLYYIKGDNMIQTVTVDGRPRNVNTGAIENSGMEAELTCRLGRRWSLHTNHSWLHMHNPVLAAPAYKGYAGADYTQGRWSLSAGLQQVCGLYTATGNSERKETFTLLDATASYAASSALRLYVHGENLLAQHYEINAGFPMPRATFMAGVEFTI